MKNGLMMKIITSCMFVFLILALILSFAGIQKVEFNQSYYNFMQAVAIRSNSWHIAIPDIPKIPLGDTTWDGFWAVLNLLINFINFFVTIINGFVKIINIIISLFTTIGAIITLLQDLPYYIQS